MLSSLFSLRVRLLIVLLIALVPAFVVSWIATTYTYRQASQEVEATTQQLAELAASSQEQLIARVQQLLATLAQLSQVRDGEEQACSALLARILQSHTIYANLGVIDLEGNVICSGLVVDESVNVIDRHYFQQALQTGNLSIGDYQVGRITGLASINFGYPVMDDSGMVQAIVFTALDLRAMSDFVAEVQLNHEATLTLIDRNGTILARSPDSGQWTGQVLPEAPIVAAMLANPVRNTIEATGVDGVSRIYTYIPVANASGASLFVAVGIPASVATARAQQILLSNVASLGLAAVLAFVAIWFGGARLVLQPLMTLLEATRRLRAGDLSARTGLKDGPSEVQHLASVFDDMVVSLQQRETALMTASEAVEQQNQRLKVLHSIDRAIIRGQFPGDIAKVAVEFVQQQVLAHQASLTLFDFENQEGVAFTLSSRGQTPHTEETTFSLTTFPDGYFETEMWWCSQIIGDVDKLEEASRQQYMPLGEGTRSLVRIPLVAQESLLGSLSLMSDQIDAFNVEQIIVISEVADQLAIAIQQARLHEKVQRQAQELEARVAQRTAQLQRSKERVEAILNNSSDAILVLASDGAIQQANPAFHNMFGYDADSWFGELLSSLAINDQIISLTSVFEQAVQHQQPHRLEVTARRQDGTRVEVDIGLAPIRTQTNLVEGVICSIRDITQQKQVEAGLRLALEKEKELSDLKSRFASMVSHEFRTPLTVIMSSSGILQRYSDRLTEERRDKHLENIQLQVHQLIDLLDDFLSVVRSGAIGAEFQPTMVDLANFCGQLVAEMQLTSQHHEIRFNITTECGLVMIDEGLIRQALGNLLQNAIKYSPKGGLVNLDLTCTDEKVIIRVRDWGIGIPQKDQSRLFEVFHRAENVGAISGTGLGMTIVKQAVEAHNGSITFESQVGEGSTFVIELPVDPTRNSRR